ncbi:MULTISPECIES: MqnA/MqnD/SBP family protein [Helicobacter]|uniref:Chorismate dehydratase n=1 Tax=Helicobacter colisuis TaxID=2949739 RepID=A0ABT0TV90_9HELI|nr:MULTISPECIES: MqnA/MqnD/SBP family protein [Helicobacter]MCI2235325.1 menaquinone biosynthesis protein [Helicobacter sp. CaF467b]MCI7047243.1 menaquinone biosynthesis protein [Helicobacter sp.]MCI7764948.1 menaquinone biosynthesis protein [Helicobacter sp.]MCL9819845.1 menaquinone biosynthesis protein [Helicobacter colisuis]MCL9821089.1 menaquinone biosynthesis protein [Helicobacter colisuis]
MRFGKIDYLNLLPFEVFIRAYPTPSQFMLCYKKRKSYPARLNKEFLFGYIDAGFVSSITALGKSNFFASKIGIVARKKVLSVICLKEEEGSDYQSATSNALLKVLGLKGRVLIGDRALIEVLKQQKEAREDYIDMGEYWVSRQGLPFVFGRLCVRKDLTFFKKIIQAFKQKSIKIPYYILEEASLKTGVSKKQILEYLKVLSYEIDKKANFGMQRFYRELRILGIKPPKRF